MYKNICNHLLSVNYCPSLSRIGQVVPFNGIIQPKKELYFYTTSIIKTDNHLAIVEEIKKLKNEII